MVKFSPAGTHFAVLYPKKIEIYSLTLKLLKTLETKSRFNTLLFNSMPVEDDEATELLCVGTEKGVVEVYRVEIAAGDDKEEEEAEEEEVAAPPASSGASLTLLGSLVGHTNRVKSISALPFLIPSTPTSPARPTILLASVSSDGFVNVYDLSTVTDQGEKADATAEPIASYDTKGTRLTTVAIAEGQTAGSRRKANGVPGDRDGAADVKLEEDDEEEDEKDIYENDNDAEDDKDGLEVELEDEEEEEEGEGEEGEDEEEGEEEEEGEGEEEGEDEGEYED